MLSMSHVTHFAIAEIAEALKQTCEWKMRDGSQCSEPEKTSVERKCFHKFICENKIKSAIVVGVPSPSRIISVKYVIDIEFDLYKIKIYCNPYGS